MAEETIPEAIRASLRCQACNTYLRPPIWMCKCGSNVCNLCKTEKGSICPVCYDTIGDHNNKELGNLVRYFKAPMSCRYNGAGCTETMDLDDILIHEEDCHFRKIKCLVADCKEDFALNELENHMSEKHQDMKEGLWVIRKIATSAEENVDKTTAEQIVEGASVVPGKDWKSRAQGLHLACDPGMGTIIREIRGYPGWYEIQWESGNRSNHKMGVRGIYEVQLASARFFAVRTWRHSDVRFFATPSLGSDDFWHIMVFAACSKKTAAKFRAEIRLASPNVPECSNVYHRPVENLENEVDISSMKKFTSCLDVHKDDVLKQTGGKVSNLQVDPTDIPFSCHVYERVFVTFDKEDIEEKDA